MRRTSEPVEWVIKGDELVARCGTENVAWTPQPGSQHAFLSCPNDVFEVLYEGTRGPGKTDAILMSFCRHVDQGYGADWRGVLFRRTYKQLADVVKKSKKWFPRFFPAATYNSTERTWTFPDGEALILSYMERPDDYDNYHGHEYPFVAFEELTTWPTDECYKLMMSTCRSTRPGMPRMYRSTTNPYGVGHNWVKKRFGLPVPPRDIIGRVIKDPETKERRVAIHGYLQENKILLHADPNYAAKIAMAARNEAEKKAWLEGSWDIIAGGMFDDVWVPAWHVLPNLHINDIPRGWTVSRSYDHGSSKPFSVGWWARSNGEPLRLGDYYVGHVPGDMVRIAEWYGCTGKANDGLKMSSKEIARGILEREADMGLTGRVKPGPADSSIFSNYDGEKSVAGDMRKLGVRWLEADKSPGSRIQGWEQIRDMLKAALPDVNGYREHPGMYICARCTDFLRTVPVLPRDKKKIDDVDTESEDHIGDETRYQVRRKHTQTVSKSWV